MIVRAIVKDTRDPINQGRIKVTMPSQSGSGSSDWIWPVVSAGYIVTPKPGDQVWIVFENGDREVPVWIGATKESADYKTLLSRVIDLENWVAAHG